MASTEAAAKAEDKRNRKGNLVRCDGRATFEEEARGFRAEPTFQDRSPARSTSLDDDLAKGSQADRKASVASDGDPKPAAMPRDGVPERKATERRKAIDRFPIRRRKGIGSSDLCSDRRKVGPAAMPAPLLFGPDRRPSRGLEAPPIRRHRSSASTAPPSRCRHAGDAVRGPSRRDARPLLSLARAGRAGVPSPFPG